MLSVSTLAPPISTGCTAPIHDAQVDATGQYLGCCSEDGELLVYRRCQVGMEGATVDTVSDTGAMWSLHWKLSLGGGSSFNALAWSAPYHGLKIAVGGVERQVSIVSFDSSLHPTPVVHPLPRTKELVTCLAFVPKPLRPQQPFLLIASLGSRLDHCAAKKGIQHTKVAAVDFQIYSMQCYGLATDHEFLVLCGTDKGDVRILYGACTLSESVELCNLSILRASSGPSLPLSSAPIRHVCWAPPVGRRALFFAVASEERLEIGSLHFNRTNPKTAQHELQSSLIFMDGVLSPPRPVQAVQVSWNTTGTSLACVTPDEKVLCIAQLNPNDLNASWKVVRVA